MLDFLVSLLSVELWVSQVCGKNSGDDLSITHNKLDLIGLPCALIVQPLLSRMHPLLAQLGVFEAVNVWFSQPCGSLVTQRGEFQHVLGAGMQLPIGPSRSGWAFWRPVYEEAMSGAADGRRANNKTKSEVCSPGFDRTASNEGQIAFWHVAFRNVDSLYKNINSFDKFGPEMSDSGVWTNSAIGGAEN